MTMTEIMVMVVVLVVCSLGLGWMFYDLNKTIKMMEQIEAERCESSEDIEE